MGEHCSILKFIKNHKLCLEGVWICLCYSCHRPQGSDLCPISGTETPQVDEKEMHHPLTVHG